MKPLHALHSARYLTLVALAALAGCSTLDASRNARNTIFTRIAETNDFGPYEIDVEARGSKVTLEGTVASERAKILAEDIAQTTKGIETVENNLVVDRTMASAASDSPTLGRIAAAINDAYPYKDYTIHVSQYRDQVILQGEVRSEAIADRMVQLARAHSEGRPVRSELIIGEKMVSDIELRNRIITGLEANPEVSLQNLEIEVERGVVTFKGARPNHRDIDRILSVANMVDGVKGVRSEIQLQN